MSQIYKDNTSGPVPPAVPEQFTADDATIGIPVANNLNLLSRDTTENNNNGIQTTADPNLSDDFYVEITNRLQGSVTTVGAVTSPMITFTPTSVGTYTIECRISGYNTTSLLGAGYSLFGSVRFDGVNSNLCGTVDRIINEEGAMSSANTTFTVSGANILINGVGYAAQTINWIAVCLYTYVGA